MTIRQLGSLTGSGMPRTLAEILASVLPGGGTLRQRAERMLRGRLKSQQARSAGTALAGATLKLVEDAMNPGTGLAREARCEIGQALAVNAALQFAQAGQRILELADAQQALEFARNTDAEEAAREVREAAEEAFEQACVNIGRAAAGDRVR